MSNLRKTLCTLLKLCLNVNSYEIYVRLETGTKTRSLSQTLGKRYVHSRRNSCHPKFMKLCLKVNSYNT